MNRSLLFSVIFLFGTFFQNESTQTYTCSSSAPCGCSAQSATLTKIVGGESAASQTWGWAASLRYTSSGSHFCGGSIISSQHILTAAHCTVGLSSPSAVKVYVGSIYISITAQVRTVSLIHIHPSYDSNTFVNDLSILKLSSPIDLTQTGVDLVCLPNVSSTVLASSEYPTANTNVMKRFFFKLNFSFSF
jgi:secreted trypsin-like serine protease